jgi:hypothetical protein
MKLLLRKKEVYTKSLNKATQKHVKDSFGEKNITNPERYPQTSCATIFRRTLPSLERTIQNRLLNQRTGILENNKKI